MKIRKIYISDDDEDETKTCFDCEFAYYSRKDDKWYCWHPREVDREVDPNSSVCSRFYEMEEEKDIDG